jgi:hypothetical protein
MHYLKAGAALLGLVLAGAAHAATCDQLNSLYQSRFHTEFKVAWPATSFTCPSPTASIVEAMNDLLTTTLSASSLGAAPDFYSWVTGQIVSLQYSDTDPTSAWSVANTGQDGVMTLHQLFTTQDPVWRTSVLVHESRHIQSDDPQHVNCDHGPNQGKAACDSDLVGDTAWGGSGYNYQFRYLEWINQAVASTPLDRALVATTLKSLLFNNFNSVSQEQVQKWGN